MARTDYPPDAWQTLQRAPFWVLNFISGADQEPVTEESAMLLRDIQLPWHPDGPLTPGGLTNEVFQSLVSEFDAVMERMNADPRPPAQGLPETAAVLDAHASPDDARAFKQSLLQVGRDIATADNEREAPEALAQHFLEIYLRHGPDGGNPEVQARFTGEEWFSLELAPVLTVNMIAMADSVPDPRESEPLRAAALSAPQIPDPLVREVMMWVARDASGEGVLSQAAAKIEDWPAQLTAAADALDARVMPEEATSFKNELLKLAASTAATADLTDADRAAFESVRSALRA